jgi:putative ABC transport system ATP-binding protein
VASPTAVVVPAPYEDPERSDSAGAVILQLDHVSKTYASGALEVHALQDVSLTVARGEYVSIVGPSGSGKSTLMNILGCLDVATAGSYMLGGVDVEEMDETELAAVRNRQIGFVFQQFNLLPSLTALRNVELPLCYAGLRKDVRRQRALDALARVGLADRVDHRPTELSGGQQQRVAVARALASRPAIVFADEPTGNLDSRSGAEVLSLLRHTVDAFGQTIADVLALLDELHATGRTIVLITHEPDVARRADRTIHVSDGRISGDLEPGTRQPATGVAR